jgi:hypothetical protein
MDRQEHKVERRLVAIFAADVAGYSRLMSQDEVGTLHTRLPIVRSWTGSLPNMAGGLPIPLVTVFCVSRQGSAEPLLRELSITTDATYLGLSFQGPNGVRMLSPDDQLRLSRYTAGLTLDRRLSPVGAPARSSE